MPGGAHRDAVGDRDRVELHRRAAGGADALLDLRREHAVVEVARHRLDPRVRDADDRLREVLGRVADAVQVGARGGARRALGEGAAAVLDVEAVGSLTGRGLVPSRAVPSSRRPRRAGALALPLAQPPEVALDLARVELAARQVQVRRLDQAPLVAGQRHPLREHVVGVGQPRAAVGPRLVGELDAVLVEQPAGLRQVGEDRLVRVDQVGVRRAARPSRARRAARPASPHTRMKPRSRYIAHSSSLTHERSSARARCSARRSRPGS